MKFIEHLEGLVSSKIEVAKGVWTLFKLETKLVGLSILPLIVCLGLLVAILITCWLAVMILIGYLVVYFTGGFILSGIISVILLNIVLFLITTKYISVCLYRMSFARTRACLTNVKIEENAS